MMCFFFGVYVVWTRGWYTMAYMYCILEYFIRRSHMWHILLQLPTDMYIDMYFLHNPNAYWRTYWRICNINKATITNNQSCIVCGCGKILFYCQNVMQLHFTSHSLHRWYVAHVKLLIPYIIQLSEIGLGSKG